LLKDFRVFPTVQIRYYESQSTEILLNRYLIETAGMPDTPTCCGADRQSSTPTPECGRVERLDPRFSSDVALGDEEDDEMVSSWNRRSRGALLLHQVIVSAKWP